MNVLTELVDDLKAAKLSVKEEAARAVMAEAIRLSSGTHTYAQLAAMDHPYARRHGSPRLDPSVINAHTELFKNSWKIRHESDGSMTVYNDAPYAQFLMTGTPTMFRRPVDDVLRDMVPAIIEQRLRERLG
jgi:hypothetical protein